MEPLEEGRFYHIYNRGNNKQNLFFEEGNYFHFLKLIKKHLLPVAEIYSYCLMRNHFHILVRIKEKADNPAKKLSNLFNAYTKAVNKKYERTGSLFQRPFKRKKVGDEKYLKQLIIYIHQNPQKHKVSKNFADYRFSSYQSFSNSHYTFVKRDEVLQLFGDAENFEVAHAVSVEDEDEKPDRFIDMR